MKLLRLPRSKVQLGAPLPWNVRDEQCHLLLSKGHVIESEEQLDALLQRGAFVDAEEVRSTLLVAHPGHQNTVAAPLNLFAYWDQTTDELRTLLTHVEKQSDFSAHADQFARHLIELLDLNPDYGIYRCVRQDHAPHFYYGYLHAVHVATLLILMARHLEWSAERTMSLVKAALTMNLAILDLQGKIASHDDPLTEAQRATLRQHPADSAALLEKAGVTDADWLAAVAQHHERSDGTGYPAGRTDICELAAALRAADVFIAKISPHALRPTLSPQDAVRDLYRDDKGGPLATALIKVFGIYPPGDLVKLASGEFGIVVQRTDNAKAPIVASITDTSGHPVTRTLRHDTSQAEFAIQGHVSDKSLLKHLAPERLYGFSKVQPMTCTLPVVVQT
jgi:HD-GYP domain-containing protein (c-di-GMP phosphodiesterase class II)